MNSEDAIKKSAFKDKYKVIEDNAVKTGTFSKQGEQIKYSGVCEPWRTPNSYVRTKTKGYNNHPLSDVKFPTDI